MSVRPAALVAGVVVALVAGFAIGRATGSSSTRATAQAVPSHTHTHGTPGAAPAGGLSISSDGYTMVPESTAYRPGVGVPFRFKIHRADREPVTRFAVVHDKPMHLIVVRRDLSGYRHLHPTMSADGTWSVPLTLPEPGIWRAYADFTALDTSMAVTLSTDLTVDGDYRARPLPAPANESTVDTYRVTYEGEPRVGATQPLLVRVNGELQRYLGSYGHLVVLREGDLAYVHVHPEPELSGGAVKFWLAVPSAGRYRMYFDFQIGGVVRTAQFTVSVL